MDRRLVWLREVNDLLYETGRPHGNVPERIGVGSNFFSQILKGNRNLSRLLIMKTRECMIKEYRKLKLKARDETLPEIYTEYLDVKAGYLYHLWKYGSWRESAPFTEAELEKARLAGMKKWVNPSEREAHSRRK